MQRRRWGRGWQLRGLHGAQRPHRASDHDEHVLEHPWPPGALVYLQGSQPGRYHHHVGDLFSLLLSLWAHCSSGPTQPSLWTTVEKGNHLVSQVSLAVRRKTRCPAIEVTTRMPLDVQSPPHGAPPLARLLWPLCLTHAWHGGLSDSPAQGFSC